MKKSNRAIGAVLTTFLLSLTVLSSTQANASESVDNYHACQSQARVGAVIADANRRHMSRDEARAAALLAIRESDLDSDTAAGMRGIVGRVVSTVYAQGVRDPSTGKRIAREACLNMAGGH
jgi:hypothetical protein